MSLALYRTYRPGSLADVIGQEHVTVPLARAIPGARLVLLPGIGHMLQYVAADRVTEEVARLAGATGAAGPEAAVAH